MADWSEKLKDSWWTIKRNPKAKAITIVSLFIVLIGSLGYAAYYYAYSGTTKSLSTSEAQLEPITNSSTLVRRQLDGVTVSDNISNLSPIAVMVENFASIRPQSGLSRASVVYEALAEGGITRFMAVYANVHSDMADPIAQIGPVRSARPYYVDWAEEYRGIYAYVGGSPEALGVTGSSQFIEDLNQFYHSQYYYRDQAIAAPHNLFTNSQLLQAARTDTGLAAQVGTYQEVQFKDDAPTAMDVSNSAPITINYSSTEYQVDWRYQPSQNNYLRWNGNQPHLDKNTNQQLSAKNIVVQKVPTTLADPDTERLTMDTIGEGEAILFQDGVVKTGRWKKLQRGDRTMFIDQAGEEFYFNAGTTWIEIVPITTPIKY